MCHFVEIFQNISHMMSLRILSQPSLMRRSIRSTEDGFHDFVAERMLPYNEISLTIKEVLFFFRSDAYIDVDIK